MDNIPLLNRIGTRILLFSILVLILSILITGLMIINISTRVLRSNISQRNLQIARRASSEISLYIQDSIDQLRASSEIMTSLANDPLLQNIILENLSMNLDKYRNFYLTDQDGTITATSQLVKADSSQFDPVLIKRALKEDLYISDVELSDDNLPYITIAVPVKIMGEKIKALVTELNLRDIWDLIDDISIGQSGGAFLISRDGLLIAHPDKAKVLKTIDDSIAPGIPLNLTEQGAVVVQENRPEHALLMVYKPVTNTDWIVVIQQPIKEAYLPVGIVLWQSLLLIVTGIVLSSIASLLLSKRVSKPLERLLNGTILISEGNLDHRIGIHTNDEIGRLSRSFDQMVVRLKEQSVGIQKSEERYRLITENVSDIIFSLDDEARIIFLNQRIESITGYNRDEFIGKKFLDLLTPESREKVNDTFQRIFSENVQSSCHMEISLTSKDGDEINFEVMLVKFLDTSGIVLYYGVGRDVTERRKLQEQLIQSEKLSSLGEIISGVAHELNNPLTGIMGLSELLLMEPDINSEAKQELQKILNEARRTGKIVKNLLTFARKYPPEKMPCQINEIIENVLEIRFYDILVSHIEIVRNMDAELPTTMADPHQLRQVFLNIVNNASDAMQMTDKKRVLRVSTAVKEDKIEIAFEDNGPGIPQNALSKIFDPFFTTKEAGKGTGLGLSVSHGIITEHGGSISAQSKEGEGTRFVIELPLKQISPDSKKKKIEKALWDLPPLRALVVDDEEPVLKFIEKALKNEGSTVDAAESGDKALGYLMENDYDLVISDLRMPGVDGWKLYSWVKENRPHITKKLVFITGDIMNPDVQAFLEESDVLYLKKPFSVGDLKRIVIASLRKQKDD